MYKTQDTTIYIQAVGGNGAQSNQETRTRRSKRVSLGDGKRKMTKAWEWRNCRLEFDLVESSRVYLILPPFDTKKAGTTWVACFLRKQLQTNCLSSSVNLSSQGPHPMGATLSSVCSSLRHIRNDCLPVGAEAQDGYSSPWGSLSHTFGKLLRWTWSNRNIGTGRLTNAAISKDI